ncbi:diphthamide biosynthesis enzyme Dph2 [Methanofollis aquaemaris]|uniref:2-(3-amino-3-carboxypropyl)histidine synthase n=1 Tax=Methanofollis aquaemaris TaxID=126734 RepID=A0A8A3S611_9EURY|nr:diphthamide biosynthesis enzyme Dph2 [Methanofollis aquaemaris]QSZ67707.1 diphthamide biosynthesis enzyme Dph2 [Methanofollis aquaemaris]
MESGSLIPAAELAARVRAAGARRVVLQLPDGLKRRAPSLVRAFGAEGIEVAAVAGDPCYGACDLALDTVALTGADLLVHVGHAPVEEREGVLYEHLSFDFDPAAVAAALPLLHGTEVGLVTTVQHVHLLKEVAEVLAAHGVRAEVGPGEGRTPLPGQVLGCSYANARALSAPEILYVGTGVFHAIGVALATGKHVIALDPYSGEVREVSGDADRLLRRRFALIEKARSAECVGIILSTKSGQARPALAARLAALSEKAMVITMREVSAAEMINFGCGAYVNTACPRLAYDDQVRFPVPLLTPQEFEVLVGARAWEEYEVDEIV